MATELNEARERVAAWVAHDKTLAPHRTNRIDGYVADVPLLRSDLSLLASSSPSDTSDGYHTFNELYRFRMLYNAALFNEWAAYNKYDVHKSIRHSDGEACFGGGWFIVVALLPAGYISNHYELKDWDLFQIPTREFAAEWDGHTASDVADRLEDLLKGGAS